MTLPLRRRIQRKRHQATDQLGQPETLEVRSLLSGTGLTAQYFDTPDLRGVTVAREDATVDFDWGSGSPDGSIAADTFSVRWSGQVEAALTENHTFHVNADDGARLWVNGQLLVDEFAANGVSEAAGSINLVAGRRYDIQLEYREGTGSASVSLEWSSASLEREPVPQARLFPSERGSITTARFNGISGGAVADLTGDADFPSSPDSVAMVTEFAAASNVDDGFGRRMHGLLHAPDTGAYTFYIAADSKAELWLSNTVDPSQSVRIAEVTSAVPARDFTANAEQKSATVHLVAGQSYFIEALHVDDTGSDHLAVGWQLPGSTSIDVIAGEHLSPGRPTVRAYAVQPVVSEGSSGPATLNVVRTGPTANALTVSYDVAGSATNGTDYQTLSGTVTIPAGQTSAAVDVTPIADSLNEGDETIEFTLRDGAGYDVGFKSERSVLVSLKDDRDVQAGGQSLWSGTALNDFNRFGATFSSPNVPGVGQVIQVELNSTPANPWSAQLRQAIDQPIAAGDVLFLEFRVRSIGGPGQIAAIFEHATTFNKSLSKGIQIGTDWTRIQLPFASLESYGTGGANAGFHLGYQAQTLQFTDFQMLTFGPPKTLAPETAFGLNNISGTWGRAQTTNVTGQPFTFGYEVETQTKPTQSWHLQAIERNEAPVNDGDTMRLSFWIRGTAGSNPRTRLVVARVNDSFSTLHAEDVTVTSSWQQHTIDVVADRDFAENGLQVAFNLGYDPQTVELGGFHWQNLDNNADVGDLPSQVPAVSYGGRDGGDSWRAQAEARIASHRKSDVAVNVVDADEQPIDGAVVSLRQNRHRFRFGSAINAFGGKLDPNGNETALKYQSEIARLFNTVVAENSHKWPQWINDRPRGLQVADFAEANDLFLRGHVVLWPSRERMPGGVWAEYDSRRASDGVDSANAWLRSTIETHFDDIIDTFRGRITEWDVVNEPFTNNDVMDIFGDDIVIDLYQRFRDADPNVALALNDYEIFAANGTRTAHRQNYDSWLTRLSNAGLLDVIGEQSHYSETNLTDIDVLGQLIGSYHTTYAAPVAITEFDVNTSDLQLQADYLRDYMMMAFSQTGVSEFLHWGFWQNQHWLPDAALYRSDFSIKPNGQAYEDAVFGNWWTDTTGTTRGGSVEVAAFLGDYDVLVQYGGNTYTATVGVDDSGNSSVTVQLDDVTQNALAVSIAADSIHESDGTAATTATVTRSGDTSEAVEVSLATSDSSEATVPATVTIPVGSVSVTFDIAAVDDSLVDGTQSVTVTASATGFANGTDTVDVEDDEVPTLTVIVDPSAISETGGTATATLTRDGDTSAALVVSLVSDDTDEATVPANVTIPAGGASTTFTVTAVDDGVLDAPATVSITASAGGLADGTAQVVVEDMLNHRMSQLTVVVQDQNGNPLPGATLDVAMTQHGFTFGTQVHDRFLTITEAEFNGLTTGQKHGLIGDWNQTQDTPVWQDALNYRAAVWSDFNHVIPTNGMQWIQYRNTGPVHLDRTIGEAHSRGVTVTGHAVVWQNDAWPTPNEFRPGSNPDAQEFHDALIAERLSSNGIMTRFSNAGDGPEVLDWDVLNEPLHELHYSNTFVGAGIYANANAAFVDYFQRANVLRPDAVLAVNDYNILSSNNDNAARQYRDLVNDLLALGAPIDQIKVQAHMARMISKEDALRRLDILAETGLPIAISEFDMRDDANQISPANQKILFEDMLEAAFEHPAVSGFSMWGIWDPGHWRFNGPLYENDWTIKEEASPWFDLVQGDWKSELLNQNVDADGRWANDLALFDGLYDIVASNGGDSTTVRGVELNDDREIVITIDTAAFVVTETNGSTITHERGTTDKLSVVLTTQPTSDVVIDVTSADTAEVTVDQTSLTFTPANWDVAQTITVSAVNDDVEDGDQETNITFAVNDAASSDEFDTAADRVVSASSLDDDGPVYVYRNNLFVVGTEAADSVLITESAGQATITVNGDEFAVPTSSYQKIIADLLGGHDTLDARAAATRMLATTGRGNDTVFGTSAKDNVRGGSGHDSVIGNAGNDNINLASGADTVESGEGNDRIRGGGGPDVVFGGPGNDFSSGGGGNDTMNGGDGNDTLIGGSGPDVLSGEGGLDHVLGGPGSDQLFGGSDNDLLDGENGNDRIEGDGGRDVLLGAKDKDTLVGLDGEDLLIGGTTTLNAAELLSIRDEWGSNRSHAQRLSNVRGDSGRTPDRLNTAFLVGTDRTDQTQTVFDDGKKDVLTGDGAEDAFFASLVDQLTDKLETEWLELL